MEMRLTAESIVSRVPGVMSAELDSDLVVLSLAGDAYVGLDATGVNIWTLLAEPMPLQELSDRLARQYQGEPNEISRDILAFLGQLDAAGLLCVVRAGEGR
jgi:hypothetical protein